mgnify:CR=1 FL=1
MPCSCEGAETQQIDDLTRNLNQATRAACDLRTILRRGGTEEDLAPETRAWIAQHDDWDRRRIAQEKASGERKKARAAALDKLNLDERRILGL